MLEHKLAPKSINAEPAPPSIKNLLSKIKDSKDNQQLETILLRFYNVYSGDIHIKSLFDSLLFDESARKFGSKLIKEEVISLIESLFDFNHFSPSQVLNGVPYSLPSTYEAKVEDIFSGIIKKPVTVVQNTQEKEDNDLLANHFLTNSIKDWPEDMEKEQTGIWKNNNSMHNSYVMSNDDNNKAVNNQFSLNSSFQKMEEPFLKVEEFPPFSAHSSQIIRFLKKKKLGVPIVLSNLCTNEPSPESKLAFPKHNPFITNKCADIKSMGIGLKEISNYVNDIIQRATSTSYKEISDQIIQIIQAKNYKEEKNIRRRIYDSLNVMKSLKLFFLDKSTKKIVLHNKRNEKESNEISYEVDDNDKGSNEHSEQISHIAQEVKSKQLRLSLLKGQFESLKCLIERNRQLDNFIDARQKIFFPFFIIEFPDNEGEEEKVNIYLNETKTQAHFAFNSVNRLYGDLDAILRMIDLKQSANCIEP